jgi:hypothetical protein
MSTVTFTPTPIQIPVVDPGQGGSGTGALTLSGTPETISLAITGAPPGVFTAEFSAVMGINGPVPPVQPLQLGHHNIQINFASPASPPPDYVTGTLVASWSEGGFRSQRLC